MLKGFKSQKKGFTNGKTSASKRFPQAAVKLKSETEQINYFIFSEDEAIEFEKAGVIIGEKVAKEMGIK